MLRHGDVSLKKHTRNYHHDRWKILILCNKPVCVHIWNSYLDRVGLNGYYIYSIWNPSRKLNNAIVYIYTNIITIKTTIASDCFANMNIHGFVAIKLRYFFRHDGNIALKVTNSNDDTHKDIVVFSWKNLDGILSISRVSHDSLRSSIENGQCLRKVQYPKDINHSQTIRCRSESSLSLQNEIKWYILVQDMHIYIHICMSHNLREASKIYFDPRHSSSWILMCM